MHPGELTPASLQLLPRDSNEQEIWRRAVAEGWQQGIRQADEIFEANSKRLERDYTGMIRYHKLALNNKITLPALAQSMLPINSKGDTMTVDEQLLRITRLPAFNTNMSQWEALGQEVGQLQQPGDTPAPAVRKLPEVR